MRQQVQPAAVVALLGLALAGCGKKQDEGDKNAPAPAPQPGPGPAPPGPTTTPPPRPGPAGGGFDMGKFSSGVSAIADDPSGASYQPDPNFKLGPQCAEVGKKIHELVRDQLPKDDPDLVEHFGTVIDQVCQAEMWTLETRTCLVGLTAAGGIEPVLKQCPIKSGWVKVEGKAEPEPRGGKPWSDPKQPPAKPGQPVPSGNADCDAMAAKLLPKILPDVGDKDGNARLLADMQTALAQRCAAAKWPKPAIDCLAAAGNQKDMDACTSKHPELQK